MARRSSHGRLKAEINIVPYIDVMLVLLVIFMVTAPLLNQGVELEPPKAPGKPLDNLDKKNDTVVFSIQRDGTCHLNFGSDKAQRVDCKSLEPRHEEVMARLNQKPQPPVLIRADKELRYEQVMDAMTSLANIAPVKISLSTAPPDESPTRP